MMIWRLIKSINLTQNSYIHVITIYKHAYAVKLNSISVLMYKCIPLPQYPFLEWHDSVPGSSALKVELDQKSNQFFHQIHYMVSYHFTSISYFIAIILVVWSSFYPNKCFSTKLTFVSLSCGLLLATERLKQLYAPSKVSLLNLYTHFV